MFTLKQKLKTEQAQEGQTIIKELGIIDMEKEKLVFLEDAAVLGKAYKDVLLNDGKSIAINVEGGFYLYRLN